jgi:hypothetical protein
MPHGVGIFLQVSFKKQHEKLRTNMKQTFLRIGTNAAVCMLLLVMSIISFHCIESPLEPVAPMSDIVLQGISIIDITRTFADFLAKDTTITRNSDGTMSYIATQHANPVPIDTIKMQLSPSAQQVEVGPFTVGSFSVPSKNYPASDLGLAGPLPAMPPGTIPLAPVSVDKRTDFDYVRINSGSLSLTITNNMPVPIDFPEPIVLRNNWSSPVDTTTIAVFTIPQSPLPANGGTVTVQNVSINGKLLRGLLTTDPIQLHTSGSLTPVNFTSSSGISVSLQSSPVLTADSALAIIPRQQIASVKDSVVSVDDSVVVQSARFSGGKFQIALANNSDVNIKVHFVINEFIDIRNGTSFAIDTTLPGKKTDSILVNANQFRIQTTASQLGTKVTFSVGITSIHSGADKKTVTKNDFVRASIVPGTLLVLQSMTGKIKPQRIPINSTVKSGIDLKDIKDLSADSIIFRGIQLAVHFPMTGGYPMDYHLTFIAKSKGRLVDSIEIGTDIGFPRIYPDNPIVRISDASGFDNFLSKFFPEVPDSFFVRGYLTLNPIDEFNKTTLYSIYDTSKVYPSVDVNFPFAAGIKNGRMTEVTGFDKDTKDITKFVKQGLLTFNIWNHIPLKMAFRAQFLGYDSLTHKGDTLLVIAPNELINAASVDGNGFATTTEISKIIVPLNGAQMVQFNKADSLCLRFTISTSNNGQVVRVRDTDYIRVYAKGDITYTVKP